MAKRRLNDIAYGRSGDKGDSANIGIAARRPEDYELLCKLLTEQKVAEYFSDICSGEVKRYELPNLHALNFVLQGVLDGGGTVSLRSDAQGKVLAAALLYMEIDE